MIDLIIFLIIIRYYTRICLIPFQPLKKTPKCGEGPELEEKAKAAASALPIKMTSSINKQEIVDVVEELSAQHLYLRICEGISVSLYFARKVC